MHRRKAIFLSVLPVIITVFGVQAQAQNRRAVGILRAFPGEVLINGKLIDDELIESRKNEEGSFLLFLSDEIRTGITGYAEGQVGGREAGLAGNERIKFKLGKDSRLKIEDLVFELVFGRVDIETENLDTEVDTPIDKMGTASGGTTFHVISREEGTIVDLSLNGVAAKGYNWWKCNFSGTVGWVEEDTSR